MTEALIVAFVGQTIGNYVWQALTDRDWWTAFERSYFQFWTLFTVWLIQLR
jgi:hypothetical protein